MSDDISIHPHGRPASNTSKPPKRQGKLSKRREALGRRRAAHSAMLKTLAAKNANAFRAPGSMNQHKQG